MSARYEQIKEYYDTGLWSEKKVRNVVSKGVITKEEYKKITGKTYQ